MPDTGQDTDTAQKAVLEALGSILDSGALGEQSRLRQLLRHIVTEELEGRGARLKAYTLGVDVFGRSQDFDPGTDSIVRVEFKRLREALDHYYLTSGANDTLRIDVPKGEYRPVFSEVEAPAPQGTMSLLAGRKKLAVPIAALMLLACAGLWAVLVPRSDGTAGRIAADGQAVESQAADALPVALLPFQNQVGGASADTVVAALFQEMTAALSRNRALRLVSVPRALAQSADRRDIGRQFGANYLLEGSLVRSGPTMQIAMSLIDADAGTVIWSRPYRLRQDAGFAGQADIVASITADLRLQLYNAAKQALEERPRGQVSAWDLYMQSSWVPGSGIDSRAWHAGRVDMARQALKLDPGLGQAHAVLAQKLAYLGSVDPAFDTDETWREAAFHAQRALELDANDADAMGNIAAYYWHSGDVAAADAQVARVLEIDPYHVIARFQEGLAAYTCAVPPKAVLDRAIAFDAAVSPDNPVRWVTLMWIAFLQANAGHDDLALQAHEKAARIYQSLDGVMHYAALLHRAGRSREAVDLLRSKLPNWPALDPRHYALTTIQRRCAGMENAAAQTRLYLDLAEAYERAAGDIAATE